MYVRKQHPCRYGYLPLGWPRNSLPTLVTLCHLACVLPQACRSCCALLILDSCSFHLSSWVVLHFWFFTFFFSPLFYSPCCDMRDPPNASRLRVLVLVVSSSHVSGFTHGVPPTLVFRAPALSSQQSVLSFLFYFFYFIFLLLSLLFDRLEFIFSFFFLFLFFNFFNTNFLLLFWFPTYPSLFYFIFTVDFVSHRRMMLSTTFDLLYDRLCSYRKAGREQ